MADGGASLKWWQRGLWGALGALLPLAIRFAGQNHIAESLAAGGGYTFANNLTSAVCLAGAGAIVAAAFQDENNTLKLLVLGVAAPALINSWAAYGTGSDAVKRVDRLDQIQKGGGSQALPPRGALKLNLDLNLVPSVFAADSSLKTFSHASSNLVDQVQGVFTGVVPNRDYFVIAGSFATLEDAQRAQTAVAAKLGRDVSLYGPPEGSTPPLYSVVVSPNLSFDDAKKTLADVSSAGFSSSYIWTFGLPLRPWTPQCARLTAKERTWALATLPGSGEQITVAISDLYRVYRGSDESRLYIIRGASVYTDSSHKFHKNTPPPPADITTELTFSGPKSFPSVSISGRKFTIRVSSVAHGCIGKGCQTATVEICEDFAQ